MSDVVKVVITLLGINIALVITCAVLTFQNMRLERKMKLLQTRSTYNVQTEKENRSNASKA
jgi:uncharacterized protein YxeA